MPFSPEMRASHELRVRQALARRQHHEEVEAARRAEFDKYLEFNRRVITDGREAAAAAEHRNVPLDVAFEIGGHAVQAWRLEQAELHAIIQVPYSATRDVVRGGWEPGGIEDRDVVIGVNELVIMPHEGLYYVHHTAFRPSGRTMPDLITGEHIRAAGSFKEQDFGRWDPQMVDIALLNFIENNHLIDG